MITPPNIGLFDVCLSSFYLIIIYFVAWRIQQKKIAVNSEYKYFLVGLSAKLIGAIAFVVFSVYYFKGGDTFRYFQVTENLRTLLSNDLQHGLTLFFTSFNEISASDYFDLGFPNRNYERNSTWVFARVLLLFNVFGCGSYLVSSLLLAVVSFIGLWLGYVSFARIYSKVQGFIFVPFFLIPTALFWSSGILRDTLIVGLFGATLYACFYLLYNKKNVVYNVLMCLVSLGFILLLKPILFLVLMPCLIICAGLFFIRKGFSLVKKLLIFLFGFLLVLVLVIAINKTVLKENPKYKLENLLQTLKGYHTPDPNSNLPNSAYVLSDMDYTVLGVLKKIPEAINVTFFRPYFWNVDSLKVFVAAMESLFLLLFFVWIIIKVNYSIFNIIKSSNNVLFLLLFSIAYAVVTGISANNFGALTRFKIPVILSFSVALIIILALDKERKSN